MQCHYTGTNQKLCITDSNILSPKKFMDPWALASNIPPSQQPWFCLKLNTISPYFFIGQIIWKWLNTFPVISNGCIKDRWAFWKIHLSGTQLITKIVPNNSSVVLHTNLVQNVLNIKKGQTLEAVTNELWLLTINKLGDDINSSKI